MSYDSTQDTATIICGWESPRRVDVWWWMYLNRWQKPGVIDRYGVVTWNQDGTGNYGVFLSFEREGVGLHCFPDFRALSDAQSFVESLIDQPLAVAMAENGRQWPGVVL